MEITEKIGIACDKGLFTCGGYLDLKKAFHTLNHSILLTKLNHYGVTRVADVSFIYNRIQYSTVYYTGSDHYPIFHGVSQLSVLGPISFLIFMIYRTLSKVALSIILLMPQIFSVQISH